MNLPLLNAAVNGVVTFDRTSFASLLSCRIDDLGHSDNSQQDDAQRGRFVPSVASILTLCPLCASLHSSLSLTLYRFSRDDVGTPHSAILARSPTAPIAEHQRLVSGSGRGWFSVVAVDAQHELLTGLLEGFEKRYVGAVGVVPIASGAASRLLTSC